MNINNWVNNVHTTAKTKGWWEKPRTEEEICMLFVSEISEATECARNGEPPFHLGRSGDPSLRPFWTAQATMEKHNGKEYVMAYNPRDNENDRKPFKPEGEAIELIDLLIRVGDYVGFRGWNLGQAISEVDGELTTDPTLEDVVNKAKEMVAPDDYELDRPLVNHFELVSLIVAATESSERRAPHAYARVFLTTIGYMVYRGWDVAACMETKMAYNEKRPYRHGGKLA